MFNDDLEPIIIKVERIPVKVRRDSKEKAFVGPLITLDDFTKNFNVKPARHVVNDIESPFIKGFENFNRKKTINEKEIRRNPNKLPIYKPVSHLPLILLGDQLDFHIKGQKHNHQKMQKADLNNEINEEMFDFYESIPIMTDVPYQEYQFKNNKKNQELNGKLNGKLIEYVPGKPLPIKKKGPCCDV